MSYTSSKKLPSGTYGHAGSTGLSQAAGEAEHLLERATHLVEDERAVLARYGAVSAGIQDEADLCHGAL